MYTKSGTTIWTDIWLKLIIFCVISSNCHGFKTNVFEASTSSQADDSESEPLKWWQIVVLIIVPLIAGVLAFAFTRFLIQTCLKVLEAKSGAQTCGQNSVPYNGPFRPQALDDWPGPQDAEFYNPGSSLQDEFIVQLSASAGRQLPYQTTTQIQPITVNERPSEQISRSANDTIDDPPPYDAAVLEHGEAIHTRKSSLETVSLDSDISIIESPPSYFMVQGNLPTARS